MIKFANSMIKVMRNSFILSVLTFIFFLSPVFSQSYHIEVSAPQFPNTEVVLAEYFNTQMVPKDTLKLDAKGNGTMKGEAFKGGLYLLYFNPRFYIDFLMDKDQEFSIVTDSTDAAKLTTFKGSEDNEKFYAYKNFLAENRQIQEKLNNKLKEAKSEKDSLKIREEIKALDKKILKDIEGIADDAEGTFFATFLKATNEPVPPGELEGSKREVDSLRYFYAKEHYFDDFSPADVRLLHTPLFDRKIKTYMNRYATPYPDSLINTVDWLLEQSRADEELFRYMLITLFNHFADMKVMGMDKVYFHIAEKYYIPEATWSNEEFITKLKDNLEKSRHTFINEPAPDFQLVGLPREHIEMALMDTAIKRDPYVGYRFQLYQIPAEYTLLYFWESDCGHCKKSTPALYEVFEKYREHGVQVLAAHMINSKEGKEKWIDFIHEYSLYEWVNCWSPYNNDFRKMYNLQSFPQLFLLDKDKKIVAKTITPEQADDLLGKLLKIDN
jgi:thiol-disulfide isomerase/thioredoxin